MADPSLAPAEPAAVVIPVVAPTPKPPTRAQAFMRKNYKWFVLLGSLIVSASLSVKENFHERERELVDAIETKSNYSRLHELALNTNLHVTAVELMVTNMKVDPKLRLGSSPSMNMFDNLASVLDQLSIEIAESSGVAVLIPEDIQSRKELMALRFSLDSIRQRVATIIENSDHSFTKDEEGRQQVEIARFFEDADRIGQETKGLKEKIYEELDKKKENYERQYLLTTWMSYGLIAVGLSLSVGGQWIAKPGEAPELKLE
jgi:hypothetical protein